MTTFAAILVFIVFNSIGFILLRKAMILRRISREATAWPTSTALILESDIIEDPARDPTGKVNNNFLVRVKYQYTVDGKSFDGSRVSFGSPAFNYIIASNVKDQFEKDKQVPIYYNPKDPADCVLAPKSTVGMPSRIPGIFLIVIGIVIPVISIIIK